MPLAHLEDNLERFLKMGLQIDPDFQRGHVWTETQQRRYLEFLLRGGKSGDIQFNHPGWQDSYEGDFVIVDGKQRLTACLRFVQNNLPIFQGLHGRTEGWAFQEVEPTALRRVTIGYAVNNLKSRADVLQWYLELNEGAVAHTEEELTRVRALLSETAKP